MAALEAVKKMKETIGRQPSAGTAKDVEFTFYAPGAKKVCLAGTFNGWNTSSMPMKKDKDGTWRIKVKLSSGRHEYKYFVDGAWAQDVPGAEMVQNCFGSRNCVVGVA